MSYDLNVFSSKPVIQAAANMHNDGGGGNLGYMSRGRKGKNKLKESINIFETFKKDEFQQTTKIEDLNEINFDLSTLIKKVLKFFKSRFTI